jgi:preprotein translocase subunit SecG
MFVFLKYFLLFVEIVCSLLLIGVILIQRSKGQGAGAAFGGGMGEAVFGSQMGNVLTKSTVVLTFIFLVNTTVLAIVGTQNRQSSVTDALPSSAGAPLPIRQPLAPPPSAGGPGPVGGLADFGSFDSGIPATGGESPAPVAPVAAPEGEFGSFDSSVPASPVGEAPAPEASVPATEVPPTAPPSE